MTNSTGQETRTSEASLSDQISIVDVFTNEGVTLKKGGSNTLKGLCPLHKENTPSFTVYPETNSFYCHGCQEGGNPISFIQKLLGYDFKSACEHLGIKLDGKDKKQVNNKWTAAPLKYTPEKQAKIDLQSAHKANNKLLVELGEVEFKPHTELLNTYQETSAMLINFAYDRVINNRDYYYPIFDKTVGKYHVKLTGHKIKHPNGKDTNPRFRWEYQETKKPADKLSYKGKTNTYKNLREAGITSADIPLYLADKLPLLCYFIILTEGEKDAEVLTQVFGLPAITNGTQLNEELLISKIKQLNQNHPSLKLVTIFSDNDSSGLKQAQTKFFACVKAGIPCIVINPATRKPVFNFDESDLDQSKLGYDVSDLIWELINQGMDRDEALREVVWTLSACRQLGAEFNYFAEQCLGTETDSNKPVTSLETVSKDKKKDKKGQPVTHFFEHLKYISDEVLDTTNPENYLIPDLMPKGEFIQ